MYQFKYGYVPDLPDHRDYKFNRQLNAITLPPMIDLRAQDVPVFDQLNLGSCVFNSVISAFDFDRKKQNIYTTPGSRLFAYYNGRVIEGTVGYDSGAQLRDGIKALVTYGECSELTVPYDITKFKRKPTKKAYTEAAKHKIQTYHRVDNTNITDIKSCLAQGYPVVFGCSVYESFESPGVAATGIVPMPSMSERVLGGHAMKIIGYEDFSKSFIVKNSWGTRWGDQGYCRMPYDYLTTTDLADDFWVINLVQ